MNEAVARAWQIDGVIDLEMLGYAGEHIVQRAPEGLPIKVRDVGDFIAVVGNAASAGLVDMFVNAVARHRLPLPVVPLVVPGNGEALRASRRSDHAAFWDCGYKAIMLTDTADMRSPHYHQPSDTLSTLNIPFAAEVCRAVVAMVMAAAA